MKNRFGYAVLAVLVALIGGVGEVANAQTIVFAPSFFYNSYHDEFERENGATTESEVTASIYDLMLGAQLANNLYVGAIYSVMQRNFVSSDVERTRTSYGASIGYMPPQGWYLIGHYFISSEYEYSETTTYKGGSGFQFDAGYLFEVSSGFFLGSKVSYRTLTYTELDNDGATEDLESGNSSGLLPMLSLAIKF